jgi:hypothetical protein
MLYVQNNVEMIFANAHLLSGLAGLRTCKRAFENEPPLQKAIKDNAE